MPAERPLSQDDGESRTQPPLKGTILGAFVWTAGARVIAEAATFAAMVLTARLVSPADFGRASIALIVTLLATALTQQGFGSPLVQRPAVSRQDIGTAWILSLTLGVGAAVIGFFVVCPALAGIFDARAAGMMQLACVSFLYCALGVVPVAMLQRELRFRDLALIDGVASICAAAVTGAVAVATHSGFAIVWGALTLAALTSVGALVVGWPMLPRLAVSVRAARSLLSFGGLSALASLLYIAVSKVDYAILAARLGPAPMGYYARGFQMAFDYPGKATAILVRLALPLMARSSAPEDLRALRTKMTSTHATLLSPYPLLLIVLAPTLVPALFGPVWEPAVAPTQILAIAGLTAILAAGASPLIQALGRPGAMVVFTAAELAVFVVVLLISVPHGLIAVCWAVVGARVVLLLVLQRFVVQPIAGIPGLKALWHDLAPAIFAGGPMMLTAWACLSLCENAALPTALVLVLATATGLACYVAALRVLFPENWSVLRDAADRIRRAAPGSRAVRQRVVS